MTTPAKSTARPYYPVLFALLIVLIPLAVNIGQTRPIAGLRPLVIVLLCAALVMGLFRLILRDWNRAAMASVIWVALFAGYGSLYTYLEDVAPDYARTDYLLSAAVLIGLIGLFWASCRTVRFEAWAAPLNTMSLVLVAFSVGNILWYEIGLRTASSASAKSETVTYAGPTPDIYYIILDMYTRSDTLEKAYGYDNSAFIAGLEEMGFNVAECAMSNYVRTELSLASSLNMDFLPVLDERITPDSESSAPLASLIRKNVVKTYLEARGYTTYAFETGFPWSEWDNADVYMESNPLSNGMTGFESVVLERTALRALEDEGYLNTQLLDFTHYRERTEFTLKTLPTLAKRPGPKFVFAHLILPHPPFVFNVDGGPTDSLSFLNEKNMYPADKFEEGYLMQLTYASTVITEIVKEILAQSATPPIIVIQGDHGPWIQPKGIRLTILNAYYLPGHQDAIVENITPVNTFRTIFNLYLGGDFEYLPNKSYFSPVPKQYQFEETSAKCGVR